MDKYSRISGKNECLAALKKGQFELISMIQKLFLSCQMFFLTVFKEKFCFSIFVFF